MARKKKAGIDNNDATLAFDVQILAMADALCNKMDAAKYKHALLRLILVKSNGYASET